MNRLQFFSTVRLARAKMQVVQHGDKGYALTAYVQHGDEPKQEITLMYKGEPRYFKSLSSIVDVFRSKDEDGNLNYALFDSAGNLDFSVTVSVQDIIVKPVIRKTPEQKQAEAEAQAQAEKDKNKGAHTATA